MYIMITYRPMHFDCRNSGILQMIRFKYGFIVSCSSAELCVIFAGNADGVGE